MASSSVVFLQLYSVSGLESQEFSTLEKLSNDMGLFLQKTNIIRDYLEDIMEEPAPRQALHCPVVPDASASPLRGRLWIGMSRRRMFWPKEIWGNYAADLAEFKSAANSSKAVEALNHMVADALRCDGSWRVSSA